MGWAVTKAHGILLQGEATTTEFFMTPRGSYFPSALRNLMQKFAFTMNLHGNARKTIIYIGGAITKAHGVLLQGRDTSGFFMTPRGSYFYTLHWYLPQHLLLHPASSLQIAINIWLGSLCTMFLLFYKNAVYVIFIQFRTIFCILSSTIIGCEEAIMIWGIYMH